MIPKTTLCEHCGKRTRVNKQGRPPGRRTAPPYVRTTGPGTVCTFDGCGHEVRAKGLCDAHCKQLAAGKELHPVRRHGYPPPRGRYDVADMWRQWADEDRTLQQIADDHGLSRERIRQLLVDAYGTGLVGLVKFRREARDRLRTYVDRRVATCFICGVVYAPTGKDTRWSCCSAHAHMQNRVRLVCDPERKAKHSLLVRPVVPTYSDPCWQKRTGRRWLAAGSEIHDLCTEAYANAWPLLDVLPDEIRQQLVEEATR